MRLVVFNELRSGTCILGWPFSSGWEFRGAAFFQFRGRPVMVAEPKDGI